MERLKDSSFWFNLSLVVFCTYPIVPDTKVRGMIITFFLLTQVILIFFKKRTTTNRWFLILSTNLFIFYLISLSYTTNMNEGAKAIERVLSLIAVPLVLYLNRNHLSKTSLRTVTFAFGIACSALVIYTLTNLFTQNVTPFNSSYYQVRTQLSIYCKMHPTYFSLTIAIGFLLSLWSLLKNVQQKGNWILALNLIVIIVGLFVASAKMVFLSTLVASIIVVAEVVSKKRLILLSAFGIVIISLTILSIPTLQKRFVELYQALTTSSVEMNNPDSLRKIIYKADIYAIGENPWFGSGLGAQQDIIDQYYLQNNYTEAYEGHYNGHNQYLQTWISAGVLPFLFLILYHLCLIGIGILNQQRLLSAVAALFSLVMLTESILARQDGIFLYAFFPSLLVYTAWHKYSKTTYINGKFLTQGPTGVQRYASEITSQLLLKGDSFRLITEKKQRNGLSMPILKGSKWEQVTMPIALKLMGSPLLINLCNAAPLIYKNHITTIHDLAFLKNKKWFSPSFARWYSFMMKRTAKNARKILTVSEFSKNEIIKYFPNAQGKIEITYNGISSEFLSYNPSQSIVKGDYILCVGTISERKQQAQLIQAFLKPDAIQQKLVLAGSKNDAVFGENVDLLKQINKSDRITFVNSPTDNELINLYKNCKFTIYLSLYEGFGIPILESLLSEKPVIASNLDVFKEIFGEAVCYTPTNNVEDIVKTVSQVNNNLILWTQKAGEFKKTNPYSFTLSSDKITQIIKEIDSSIH